MGRVRKRQVKFYVSDEELEKLKKNISKSGLRKSNFLRKASLENEVIVIEGLDELVFQIKKIGVNLNQIAKQLNSGTFFDFDRDLQIAQKGIGEVWQALKVLVERIK